ncbi:hypothetical protein PMIT1342_00040 [Prochlorococcus marinus str. MIT 1342]|nr:hypothetical protein PMIT1342_00040 [Prochlorococcus marinus str. MIT 1342]
MSGTNCWRQCESQGENEASLQGIYQAGSKMPDETDGSLWQGFWSDCRDPTW